VEERNLLRFFDSSKQWDGSKRGRLLVIGTRCYGDMIKWSRFFPVIENSGMDWALLSWPELVPTFKRLLPVERVFSSADGIPPYDFWVTVLWLHEYFGKFEQTKPLLITAAPEKIAKYQFLRQKSPVVGFCWQAAEWEMQYKWRRLQPEEIKRILQIPVQWVNLQYHQTLDGGLNPELETWEDTAGIIQNLDAIVSADTAVPHFSGSMGKKTFVLHGRAQTSVTEYQPFETLYSGVVRNFLPDYGNPNTSKTSTDKFLDFVNQNPEFWR
jgi:hypothetical protein